MLIFTMKSNNLNPKLLLHPHNQPLTLQNRNLEHRNMSKILIMPKIKLRKLKVKWNPLIQRLPTSIKRWLSQCIHYCKHSVKALKLWTVPRRTRALISRLMKMSIIRESRSWTKSILVSQILNNLPQNWSSALMMNQKMKKLMMSKHKLNLNLKLRFQRKLLQLPPLQ